MTVGSWWTEQEATVDSSGGPGRWDHGLDFYAGKSMIKRAGIGRACTEKPDDFSSLLLNLQADDEAAAESGKIM